MICELKIEKKYLEEIIRGTKKEEYRSLSDYYFRRFFVIKNDTPVAEKPITAFKLVAGYRRDSAYAIVENKGIFIDEFMERFGFNVDDRFIKGEVFSDMIERTK
jgi:hypothetical protein